MKGFLYGQTEYNILMNTNRLDDYIAYAKKNSFDFLSITDSNLYGHYKFYKKCREASIQPVIGLEYSFRTEDQNISKVLLYARNMEGYRGLLKISSRVKTEGIEDLDSIRDYADGLNLVFVFNDSFLERLLSSREWNILNEFCMTLKSFQNSYIGISYTNKLDKLEINRQMEEYAARIDMKCVPIHQCLYLRNQDSAIFEALTAIGNTFSRIGEFEDYSFEENPLDDERLDAFVQTIQLELFQEKIELPKYPYTKGASSKEYLHALCYKGLEKRKKNYKNYFDRLTYELSVIDKMGYNDYFLIVWDFIKYAKQNGILVGPGRGSAAGSLVAYSLGITEVDPIQYDLLFERFLNPERVSMPDIDTDFPDIYRDKVIDHVKDVFGKTHVCNISAYGTFLVKSSIRDLGRVYKMETSRVEKIIEMVETYGFDAMLEEYKGNDLYQFLYIARGLEGLPRHISTHAAGIILSALPLDEIIPLQEGINGLYQSQLEASDLEKIGLLKMDFLGIRNLTMIDGMMRSIPGFDMQKLRNIPLDDAKVYWLLQNADTLGLFQLESAGIRKVLLKLKPSCFEDLVAVLALYRPGPMENIDEYIRRKHEGNFTYLHPSLEPILKPTYGIIIYQEQIMKIAEVFSGYSLGEADVLRRAVSKKDSNTLMELKQDFVKRSMNKGYSREIAENIYDLIYKFANYGFNRSHSVAYALLSYQMAYFKANYFPVFMANILNNTIGSTKTLSSYIRYARKRGLITCKPNINLSKTVFVSSGNNLYLPLNTIFSIGDIVAKSIVEEREKNGLFHSFEEFKNRCSFLSSQTLQALIYSGALDIFGKTKKSMTNVSTKEDELFLRHMEGVIEDTEDFDFKVLKEQEYKYLGFNLEYSLFKNIDRLSKKYHTIPLQSAGYQRESRLLVELTDFKEITTKKKQKMLIGRLSDNTGEKSFVIFPKVYQTLPPLAKDQLYLVLGILNKDNRQEDNIQILKIASVGEDC